MGAPLLARKLILLGVVISVLGIVLNLGGVPILIHIRNPGPELIYAMVSIAITLIGLLTGLIGSLIWAQAVPLRYLLPWALPVGVPAFAVVKLLDVSIQGSLAIFVPVFYAVELSSALIVLIALTRFTVSRRKHLH